MPIKFEIVADSPAEFFIQLEDLLRGHQPGPSWDEAQPVTTTIFAPPEAVSPAQAANDLQAEINKAPAVKPPAKKATKKKNGVKPLPADDDPLAAASEPEEEPEEELPFDPPGSLTPEQTIAAAVAKLRDLHAKPAGQAAIRALREKYSIQFLHEVPAARAQELMADALRIEKEVAA